MHAPLLAKSLPSTLRPEAMDYATICLDLIPGSDNRIPYEQFWNKNEKYVRRFFQPFGCLSWVSILERERAGGKGGPRNLTAISFGINLEHKRCIFYPWTQFFPRFLKNCQISIGQEVERSHQYGRLERLH